MTFNLINEQMSSETASLKIWLANNGTFQVPSTNSSIHTSVFIAHGYLSDDLIAQVGFTIAFTGGGTTTGQITPWTSGDGQTSVNATVNASNLIISGFAQTAGLPTLAYTVTYYYRLLVP